MGTNESRKSDTNWLDPLNRQLIQEAVKNRHGNVKLRDGRIFRLTYSDDRGYETVTLVAADGTLVPRGEFAVKKILESDWTTELTG